MKKLLLLVALFSIALGVQARKVAFRVDMTGQTVSANGVHFTGNFKNIDYAGVDENPNLISWDPAAYALTANGNIYTFTESGWVSTGYTLASGAAFLKRRTPIFLLVVQDQLFFSIRSYLRIIFLLLQIKFRSRGY